MIMLTFRKGTCACSYNAHIFERTSEFQAMSLDERSEKLFYFTNHAGVRCVIIQREGYYTSFYLDRDTTIELELFISNKCQPAKNLWVCVDPDTGLLICEASTRKALTELVYNKYLSLVYELKQDTETYEKIMMPFEKALTDFHDYLLKSSLI